MAVVEYRVLGGHRPCDLRLDLDYDIPHERTLINHLFRGIFYEPETSRLFTRILQDGDSVIDVGGNCGYFTILAAALVGSSGRVLTFEPDPNNGARLRANCALNGLTNVTIVDQPALDEARPVSFYVNHDNGGGSALWDTLQMATLPSGETPATPMAGTTIDAEVARLGLSDVKLIKIDTEGAEHSVVRGAAGLLANGAVPFVVAESHDFALRRMASSENLFRDALHQHGYQTYALMFEGSLPLMLPRRTRVTSQYVYNLLFSTEAAVGTYWPVHALNPGDMHANPGNVIVTANGFAVPA